MGLQSSPFFLLAAKILVFCLITLHAYTTIRKSSQTSMYLEKLQAAESLIYDSLPQERPWKDRTTDTKAAKTNQNQNQNQKRTKRLKKQKDKQHDLSELTDLSKWVRRKPSLPDKTKPLFLMNFTHYFSHIPKSGAEYAAGELMKLIKGSIRLPGNQTEMEVQRAQQRFMEQVYPEFFQQRRSHIDLNVPTDLTGETEGYTPPVICNAGTTPLSHLKDYYIRGPNAKIINPNKRPKYLKWKCDMWTSEWPWSRHAHSVYTIVRDPYSHILSQYFHCTESRDHARPRKTGNGTAIENRQDLMPPLDEWMQTYVDLMNENLDSREMFNRTKDLKNEFHCYNPMNSESVFTKFMHKLPKSYTYPYPHDVPKDRPPRLKKLDMRLFSELKDKYKVIGDTSRMTKTICAIFIKYTEGQHVPEVCDCTHVRNKEYDGGEFLTANLYVNPHLEDNAPKRSFLTMGYNASKHAHGVTNHGSSYAKKLTKEQRALIERLRGLDLVLYNVSRAVFDEQVSEMESEYKIKICDKWNPPERVPTMKEDP
eukprot:CAMPEP_0197180542 /NCGR_PEP_ID=MMETSP1423-20130617/5121_1 /TAXON_ID=476441 /ORGANISM="Pseudo-nitzschia heimii, Strain UNC1101" /LENGTH=536 /DNA_ID=CAMNT_0042630633 /DNA_START=125 /DNA_END=1735 /DNA_ORIENTATION=+